MTPHSAMREVDFWSFGSVALVTSVLSLIANGNVIELGITPEERCLMGGSFFECLSQKNATSLDENQPIFNYTAGDNIDQIAAILDAECRDMNAMYQCSEQYLRSCFRTVQSQRLYQLYLIPMQRFGALCANETFRHDYVRDYDCIWKADQCSKEVAVEDKDKKNHNCAELKILAACVEGLVKNECDAEGGSTLERIFHTMMGPQLELCASKEEPAVDIQKRQDERQFRHLSRRMYERSLQ